MFFFLIFQGNLSMSYYCGRKINFVPENPQKTRTSESKGCKKRGGRGRFWDSPPIPH